MQKGIHYEFEIVDRPTFSYLKILLHQGQEIKTERGTMMFFEPSLEIHTKKAEKGFFKSIARTLAGETFLLNYFTAPIADGWLSLAPPFPGDIMHIPLQEKESWVVFSGGYLASSVNLTQSTGFQGIKKSVFSGEKAFAITVNADQGPGDLFVSGNGAFIEWTLKPEQQLKCDNGHLVAMQTSVSYDIKRVGGWKETTLSGEGVVCELTGPGRVIIQSRNPQEYAMWLYQFMPKPSSH